MLKVNKLFLRSTLILIVFVLFLIFSIVTLASNDYPTRPVKLIVPFSAGGGSDRMCRIIAPLLEEELGVSVVIENRAGAGSQIGLTVISNAKPDGYTIGQANQINTSYTINVQEAPYTIDDFAWVNCHMIDPIAVHVLNEKPWNDLKELTDYIKENPGEISFGVVKTSGNYIALLKLKEMFDLDFTIVPYPGTSKARAAMVGGHVDAVVAPSFSQTALKGQAKCLAIGSEERSKLWPEAPTFYEVYHNEELHKFVQAMASYKYIICPKEFKEKYPERWKYFLNAYEKAFHSAAHMKEAEKTGLNFVLTWTGPEKAEEIARDTEEIIKKYASYFEK